MKATITYSEIRERRSCPYRAYLNHNLRLSPKLKSAGLREGSIGDEGMNALYTHYRDAGELSFDVMSRAMRAEAARQSEQMINRRADIAQEVWDDMSERVELLIAIARNYVEWAKRHDDFEVVTMQYEGRTPVISPSGRASTRTDFLYKPDGYIIRDDGLWLLENKWWKTWSRIDLAFLQRDEQCGMYLWGTMQEIKRGTASQQLLDAAKKYGLPRGVLYNVVKKKLPVVPEALKKGGLSQRKDIDTTYDVYVAAIEAQHKPTSDEERAALHEQYAEILDLLRDKSDSFHYREIVERNEAEIEEIGARIWSAARSRDKFGDQKWPERMSCSMCAYSPLCLEWSDDVVNAHFYRRDVQPEEYSEEEEVQAA